MESMNISCSCPHDEYVSCMRYSTVCTYKRTPNIAYGGARRMLRSPTPSADHAAAAGVSLVDGCSATRRETRSPFARRRGSLLLAEEPPSLADGLPCKAVRSSSEKDARLVLADSHPYTSCYGCSLGRRPARWRCSRGGERIKRACCSPGRESARRARQLACMHEARCSLPKPLPAHRLRHASPSELGARHGSSPSSSCSQLAGPVLARSSARSSVLMLVAARGRHLHQGCSELASLSPMKLGVRRRRRRVRARWPLAWCSPTIIIRTLLDARGRKKKHEVTKMGGKSRERNSFSIFSIFKSPRTREELINKAWDEPPPRVRKVFRSDEGHWVAEPGIDWKASAFIAKFHAAQLSDQSDHGQTVTVPK
ncbi:hypothetical protein Dimus_012027 [Dionaea muscipula]